MAVKHPDIDELVKVQHVEGEGKKMPPSIFLLNLFHILVAENPLNAARLCLA